jgi:hypothetical protein
MLAETDPFVSSGERSGENEIALKICGKTLPLLPPSGILEVNNGVNHQNQWLGSHHAFCHLPADKSISRCSFCSLAKIQETLLSVTRSQSEAEKSGKTFFPHVYAILKRQQCCSM